MPPGLRRLLHRALDQLADPRHARGQAGGVRCAQLDEANLCRLFGDPRRPAVCARFDFDAELCGEHRDEALARIAVLELAT